MKIQFKKLAVCASLTIITAVSLTACGNSDKNKEDMPKNENITTEKVAELENPATSGISFKDKEGKTVSLNELKGKVVFINFWATWCPPCIQEMPSINKLKQSFKDNEEIVFLMVDVDNKMEKSTAFMAKNGYDLPVYVPAGNIPPEYLGEAIPTTVILDKSGDMIGRIEGGRDYTSPEMLKILNELVESN
ncbi:TPA: redoxin family protein [Elizabethkingia anophelis]|nr:redoxin family protein [Elizabethkingia anophelis]HBN6707249.1 redoxin family protein [Elizabethkingia anophelis]HBN6711283.1 redoxin family protein [Elizabethkingia anophelis]HBN6714069.1 redoxin family protein [Elizabethkingia anophelis]HBN6719607.1 redoxin family protein [Elizabethkingia anophelis]